ncbi:MAG: hypothetical protein KDC18_04400 [Alphaproteobacteria bacterium]|nr:hypothetical protein [Alphaproteobacteria bacterium]MCB9931344.1 hypothetical protein [Alphaproteobacteria bacterium]
MFGLSLTKLIVLGLAIYGAWQLFRWIENRGSGTPPAPPPQQQPDARSDDGAVEMEQDPKTGVWRPRDRG